MRVLVIIAALAVGLIGYGGYRQHEATKAKAARLAALQDSVRRLDSLQKVADAEAAAAQAERDARVGFVAPPKPALTQYEIDQANARRKALAEAMRRPTRVVRNPGATNRP
jgi:hypothetical protein